MVSKDGISVLKISEILENHPYVAQFLDNLTIDVNGKDQLTLSELLETIDEEEFEDKGIDPEAVLAGATDYINQMIEFLGEADEGVKSLTVLPGTDKSGVAENFDSLEIKAGEVVSIVGPTGSGKSRLLADIEWAAQNDTPTRRSIRINGNLPDKKWRFSQGNKLVAQLSQNMNFVMDLSVYEFLELHATSRLVEDEEELINKIISAANHLAGEKFDPNSPVTSLSGGQSRALMIADTAILSKSPIVLIDEIENAGIDRKKALALLIKEEKIVLMATHDPLLALMGDKRIVIRNGGIHRVIETSEKERGILEELGHLDQVVQEMRTQLRKGESLTSINFKEGGQHA